MVDEPGQPRSICDEKLVAVGVRRYCDMQTSVLQNTSKYRRGQSLRHIASQLNVRNERVSIETIRKKQEQTNVMQLKSRLQQAWRSVKVETLQALIKSMPDRMRTVIKQRGNTVKDYFLLKLTSFRIGLHSILLNYLW